MCIVPPNDTPHNGTAERNNARSSVWKGELPVGPNRESDDQAVPRIAGWLRLLLADDQVVELRALKVDDHRYKGTVSGKQKDTLGTAQYNVVKALDAGQAGLSKGQLVRRSCHQDAVNVLKRLCKSDHDRRAVIQLPERATASGSRAQLPLLT